jgi:hypothetical protein
MMGRENRLPNTPYGMATKKARSSGLRDAAPKTNASRGIPIEETVVHSVREIVQAFEKEDLLHDSRRELLLRGENSAQYIPTAGIFRHGVKSSLERRLFDEFRNLIPAHSNIDVRDEWLVLWLAQHHGVPTRLFRLDSKPARRNILRRGDKHGSRRSCLGRMGARR